MIRLRGIEAQRLRRPGGPNPAAARRRTPWQRWRVPLLLSLIAVVMVWVFDVNIAHACAIVAGAAALGLCNDFAEGLGTMRLQPGKLAGHEQGATEQQFLAYSLTSGARPVGERAYRHFLKLARGRMKLLGLEAGGPESAGNRVHAGSLLYSFLTDRDRGARMTHAELRKCLDQLDALLPAETPASNRQVPTESRPHA